jgi:hypothetical protein
MAVPLLLVIIAILLMGSSAFMGATGLYLGLGLFLLAIVLISMWIGIWEMRKVRAQRNEDARQRTKELE